MQVADAQLEQYLKDLQDPTTRDGFWNVFNSLWGQAQSQSGFDFKRWLAVQDYIKDLESKLADHNKPVTI